MTNYIAGLREDAPPPSSDDLRFIDLLLALHGLRANLRLIMLGEQNHQDFEVLLIELENALKGAEGLIPKGLIDETFTERILDAINSWSHGGSSDFSGLVSELDEYDAKVRALASGRGLS